MSLLSSKLSLVSILALSVAACTAPSEPDSDSSNGDLHVKPTDSENLGRLTVTTPPGWVLPVNPADDATVAYRSSAVPFDVAQRLNQGDGTIAFTGKFDRQLVSQNVPIAKGANVTYGLGSFKATYDPTTTLVRDFGPKPALKIFFTAPGNQEVQAYGTNNSYPAFWNGSPTRAALAPPGSWRFSWGLPVLDDVKHDLASGENAALSLQPAEKRATIRIKKPSSRDLPNPPASCHVAAQEILVQRNRDNSNGQYGEPPSYDQRQTQQPAGVAIQDGYMYYASGEGIVAWAAVPLANDTDVRVFPFVATEAPMHYELFVSNLGIPIALNPGDTKTIQLERLDIDDVAVTREDGTVYNVKGTYQVFKQGAAGSWVPLTSRTDCGAGAAAQATWPTGTGIDVPAGAYRVLVNYTTAEGAKTQDNTYTVP